METECDDLQKTQSHYVIENSTDNILNAETGTFNSFTQFHGCNTTKKLGQWQQKTEKVHSHQVSNMIGYGKYKKSIREAASF